jgi:hypothetical protein
VTGNSLVTHNPGHAGRIEIVWLLRTVGKRFTEFQEIRLPSGSTQHAKTLQSLIKSHDPDRIPTVEKPR